MKGGGKRKPQTEPDGETETKKLGQSSDSNGDEREWERDEDGNDDGEEEDYGGDEVGEAEEGKVGVEGAAQEERPKLDDGYFEIEAIRRRRIRKGQFQYLIKWRGWPETANTWEPVENLQSCSDVIDAFEESLRSGKHSRKRKRRSGGTPSQPKKKQQFGSGVAYDLTDVDISVLDKPSPSASLNNVNVSRIPALAEGSGLLHGQDACDARNIKMANKVPDARSGEKKTDEGNDKYYDTKLSELKAAIVSNGDAEKFSIGCQGGKSSESNGFTNGNAENDHINLVQNNRCTGSKRRKAGPVKRFKQDPVPFEPNPTKMQNVAVGYGVIDTKSGIAYPSFQADDSNQIPRSNNSISPSAITKILKPIGFSASVTDNSQDVLVTFLALRSDGKEVMVDNRYLKANNPHLLISFYEQHLKYSPTA